MDTVRYFKDRAKARLKELRVAGDPTPTLQQVQHQIAIGAGYSSWAALLRADGFDRQLAAVMDKEPLLNAFGVGPSSFGKTWVEKWQGFDQDRADLRASAETVRLVHDWLVANIEPRKTLIDSPGSYGMKHKAERAIGQYVTNGQLIAAAIMAGYPYRFISGSPNALFGMSLRSIRAVDSRLRVQAAM